MPESATNDLKESIRQDKALIAEYKRRLHKLKLREAREGKDTPPEVLNEIEDLEKEIKTLQNHVRAAQARLKEYSNGPADAGQQMFTNREDEIKLIMASNAAAYRLVDAPPGYGKTELLKELKRRFITQGWQAVLVSARPTDQPADLAKKLVAELKVTLPAHKGVDIPWGVQIGSALSGQWPALEKKGCEGIVLLIDLEGKPAPELLQPFLNECIPEIEKCLRPLAFFKTKASRFRVIIAGRYLAGRATLSTNLPLKSLSLSPFDYNVIHDYVAKCTPSQQIDESIAQLAAHLMYLTGGHPGCVAGAMSLYQNQDPDTFFTLFAPVIWSDFVLPTTQNLLDEILPGYNADFKNVMNILATFRYVDEAVLRRIIAHYGLNYEEYKLADKLTGTYIYERKDYLIEDDIVRRLLAINQWMPETAQPGGNSFANRCCTAQTMCRQRLQDPRVERAKEWAIEYLFQGLQQHAGTIDRPDNRRALRQSFFEQDLPAALNLFIHRQNVSPQDYQAEWPALLGALEKDWEFQFTVNYYLREDGYNTQPYWQVLAWINEYFKRLIDPSA